MSLVAEVQVELLVVGYVLLVGGASNVSGGGG